MQIVFNQPINQTETQKIFSLFWKEYTRKFKFSYILFTLFGIILFFIGYSSGYDISKSSSSTSQELAAFLKNSDKKMITNVHTTVHNYHIFVGLGIAFVLLGFYMIFSLSRTKKKLLKETLSNLDNFSESSNQNKIEITEDFISKENEIEKVKFKWKKFKRFKILENYIFIFENNTINTNFICLNKTLLNEQEFIELNLFLEKKLLKIF